MNMISGTTGISGATDSNFVLRKDKRGGSTATLYCTGRDIEYRELTLEFDGDTHVWNLLSDSVTTEPRPQDKLTIFLSEYAGILICQECGSPFVAMNRCWNGNLRVEYICKTYLLHGKDTCPSHRVHALKVIGRAAGLSA